MKKFGSIKVATPFSLKLDGKNEPVLTESGKLTTRKGKKSVKIIPEAFDKEPRVLKQPDGKFNTGELAVPAVVSYRNKPVDSVKDGDILFKNKEPSINLITKGRSLEVLSKGTQEKVITAFLKKLDGAPIQVDDKRNIKSEFLGVVKARGIRAGLEHLMEISKEIAKLDDEERRVLSSKLDDKDKRILRDEIDKGTENIDELRGEFERMSSIEKGQKMLGKFKSMKESKIERGRDKLAKLKGMGDDEPFEPFFPDDSFFQN